MKEQSATEKSGFHSYWSQWRAVKKAKDSLPKTPEKKARIIERLSTSPRTSRILEDRGILLTPEVRKGFQVGRAVMSRLRANGLKVHAYK